MTRVAIRRKIIKINKIMSARVYAHARKGFIATLVTGKTKKMISKPLFSSFQGCDERV